MQVIKRPLYLAESDFCYLLQNLGPSLGLWRGAEIAALREQRYPAPVLDLGCGDGFLTALVLKQVAVGLDPDARVLADAQRRGLYVQTEAAGMQNSRTADGSIATILSNSVLEHIPEIDLALAAAARKLMPGGRLIFTAPSEAFSRWLTLPFAGYANLRNRHYAHLNLWSLERWVEHLNLNGLEVEIVRPYLRARLVRAWDVLELMQRVHLGRRRLFGMAWRRMPSRWLTALARRAAQTDLSSDEPGGGRLIVARKRG